MKVFVLGGDGFCGWPTSLHLSNLGHQITIIDNLSRRNIDNELEAGSLTPIRPVGTRLKAWREERGRDIAFYNLDIAQNYHRLLTLIQTEQPDAVVHFAEQRAAPYSMKSAYHKRYTVNNNLNATHNVLCAIVESGLDIHLAHLGTMGVYGYGTAGMKIPEGYLPIEVTTDDGDKVRQEILYPANPGSIYHMTKTQDQLFFAYYAKNDGVRITDLHQGIVWGTNTRETLLNEKLINRFDYDGDYGTVLNRFLMQGRRRLSPHRPRHRRPDQSLHPHPGHRPLHPTGARESPREGRARQDSESDDRNPSGTGSRSTRLRDNRS